MSFFQKKPEDLTGLASFFDFLCAVFSRIAYSEDPMPLFLLSGVFRIIPKELLVPLSKITNIAELNKEEQELYNLNSLSNTIPVRTYNKKTYVNFIPYAEKINILIEDTIKSPYYKKETDPNIKVISIADSNYGNVLVIGIKYIPNFIFTSFRGTYSLKTALSYLQGTSLTPTEISPGEKLLVGIAKIEFEMLHTILAANADIVTNFLKQTNVIPVFTGHSLGGALATILDLEYCSMIEKRQSQDIDTLSSQPVCISFGSPRVLSETTSTTFCNKIVENKTLFHRYSNDGDPITALPVFKFYHPCSSSYDKKNDYGKLVKRNCKSSTKVSTNLARSEYTKAINCTNEELTLTTKLKNAAPNMFDHMTYLYISFAKGVDIVHLFGKSVFTLETTEIGRVKTTNPQFNVKSGDTEMRIVQMTGNGTSGVYTIDFIDLVNLRKRGRTILPEDSLMNNSLFSILLNSKKNVPNVIFKDELPLRFSKRVDDKELTDYNNSIFRLNKAGGKKNKNKRTIKNRKNNRCNKSKISKISRRCKRCKRCNICKTRKH